MDKSILAKYRLIEIELIFTFRVSILFTIYAYKQFIIKKDFRN